MISVDYDVLNQKGSPAWYSDVYANIPTAGYKGRMFISTDTYAFYRDTGTGWDLIGGPGTGTITGSGTSGQVSYFNGSSTLAGSNNLFWDSTNNRLGIGTATPGVSLDIHATGTNAQFNGTGTSNAYLVFQNAGTSKWRIGNTYNAGANTLDLYNVGLTQTALSFNASTNVGTFATSIIINNGAISSYGLQVNNSLGNPGFVAYQNSDSSYALQVATTGATTINLNSNASASYINTAGNFGLGTASPSYKLDVTGNARITTSAYFSTASGSVGIGTTTSLTSKLDVIGNGTANSIMTQPVAFFGVTNGVQIGSDGTDGMIGVGNSNTNLILLSRISGNYAKALTINPTGNILIGTTTTTIDSSNFGLVFQQDGSIATSRNVNGSSGVANFYGNAGRFLIYGNGTAQNTTGTYGILSDLRLKDNIVDSTNKLENLLKIRIVNYNLKQYPSEKLLGVIAQELEAIFPGLVETNENGYKGVKMSIFIPIIIKAIQELNDKLVKNNIN
jgi:hypothetical protein